MTKVLINNTLIVKLNGDIDHHNSNRYRKEIDKEINSRPVKNIIFDFKGLEFMDSSGIGMILGRYKLITGLNGKMMIASPNSQIIKILSVSGINKIIDVYETVDKALNSVREATING